MDTVKIYREKETESLIVKDSEREEYNMLASELGFTTVSKAIENKTPIVYPYLNSAMVKQLRAVCPVKVKAEDYTKSAIPLEILKVFKYCKDNQMFEGFEVWYNDVQPDPLLVGWKYQSDTARERAYSWQVDRYLIGRWGDCALELPDLVALGFEKMKQELTDKASMVVTRLNDILANPDPYIRSVLAGQSLSLDIKMDAENTLF